jgi:hypothetical protein
MPTKPQAKTKPLIEHPSCPAIPLFNQYSPSGKIAFHSNSRLILEFGQTQVVVHEDRPPVNPNFRLGSILYTFEFWNQPARNPRLVLDDGRMEPGKNFILLRIRKNKKGAECMFCGKGWESSPPQKEAEQHIAAHLRSLDWTLQQPHFLMTTWMGVK